MKWAAILMALVMIAAAAGVGYLYLNSTIRVDSVEVIATEAASQQATFEELKAQMAEDRVLGTSYGRKEIGEAEDYQFLTFRVRLDNRTALTADMVELSVTPLPQDVLQMRTEQSYNLLGHSRGDISATILTGKNSGTVREITVTYYLWGVPFSMKMVSRQ